MGVGLKSGVDFSRLEDVEKCQYASQHIYILPSTAWPDLMDPYPSLVGLGLNFGRLEDVRGYKHASRPILMNVEWYVSKSNRQFKLPSGRQQDTKYIIVLRSQRSSSRHALRQFRRQPFQSLIDLVNDRRTNLECCEAWGGSR